MKSSKITNHRYFPVDGCLPDIDYSLMRMKNLDDLDLDKVLMEYEYVHVQRIDHGSNSGFNLKLTSSNIQNIGKQLYEDVFVETENCKNGIKTGDQVIQINGVSVRNLKQANELLERSGKSVSLLLLRPVKISNSDGDKSFCIPSKSELINKTCIKNQIIQSSRTLPHIVYTTPDRLRQTIWLQQYILREKLNLLSKTDCNIDNDIIVKQTNSNLGVNEKNMSEDQTKIHGVTGSPHKFDSRTCSTTLASWRIRRSADGTRYITKKYKRPLELSNCKPFRQNVDDRHQNDKNLSVSRTNFSCSDISEKHKNSDIPSESMTNFENVNNRLHLYHFNNIPTVNNVTSSESNLVKRCEIKFENTETLKNSYRTYDIQSNIPTSILIKPPILFRRSQSTSVPRKSGVRFDTEKKNIKLVTNNSHYSMLYNNNNNNKQSNKLKLNSPQTSVSVVTI
ncbi:unnamed protein product [Schistosoma margrebowiei]|uniref:PDZ domain-containing protein n=1 Tax=Schistosoma margrebowiei TaxID=48269 RepID=A0AA85A5K0_9TREM|nr:unnamed protein product [Schistosoma margrebowiei]